jgi:predicted SAM-dependent methyltransferase
MMKDRVKKLLSCINPSVHKGLEIGAFNNPLITKEMGCVRYVDHESTEELRAKAKSSGWDAASIEKIVNVDFVPGEKTLSEVTAGDGPYDYVIASHVVEHVPDLIGWFREIYSVLKPDGILSLAVPDKRFTFDYYRRPTNLPEIIDAFLQRSRKPSFNQIFDYYAEFDLTWVDYDEYSWIHYGNHAGDDSVDKGNIAHENKLRKAWDIAKEAQEKKGYVDVHCWVFTDISFLNLLVELNAIGLLDFKVANIFETQGNEFIINLQAVNSALNEDEKKAAIAESIKASQDLLVKKYRIRNIINPKFWPQYRSLRLLKKKIRNWK